ncbi:T9SS type B sorting domain-containing protein [Maribacter polysiphoniae]|uniref:T9SS type B sorting domain-containing protein n=1 Tax=Maribacter polysiphoniae TaxID=429344 RepID=UPI0023575DCC|nr:T9SS type B sorting domain-containing protein [Maribacter polysiphoniae]
MFPKSPRHILYALLLLLLSAVCTSAIANYDYKVLAGISEAFEEAVSTEDSSSKTRITEIYNAPAPLEHQNKASTSAPLPMFMTIIQGADLEVNCTNDGSTIARFNLCGDSDDRVVSLSGAPYSSVSWEKLGGSCSADINENCPETSNSCYTQVSIAQNFTIDASTISSTTGGEFRVRVNGSGPYYYFKVKKSTITQTYVKQDNICGVPGRIQITNLSSAYEFSIDNGSGFGPWQGPIFNDLAPGTYIVKARLQNTPNTCEYPYEPITIEQLDIAIDVTFTDALCSGDTGTITVTANNVPGPYKYTLLDSSGVAQEFTAFISDNPYTFSAVGFGTYTVQVETQQCTGDPLNGIDPPRESFDTSGNPIVIGNGLSPLDASTEVHSSFGCSTITDVDVTVNTSGGSAPYTFTVNGGSPQPSYTGTTTYTATSPGSYDFLITDSNGCTISASANVENLLPPVVTATGIDGTCSNGGAKIIFNVADARGYNLSYRVNSGDPWETTPEISVPATTSGTLYDQIEVRYQQGGFECTLPLANVTVSSVGVISGSASKISDRTCDGSGGTNGGQIDFVGPFTGGSGSGYVFSIDGLNFSGTTSYSDLAPGTYTPIIKDGGGCRLELTPITILDVDPPTDIDFVQSNINCSLGTSDVQLTATANAGIAQYVVLSPTPGFDADGDATNDVITGLSTNTSYIFQITDVNGCTYTEGFTPAQISSIRARVKSGGDLNVCNGASDGSGTFLIDGFANNYTYDINGGLFTGGPQSDLEVVLPLSGAGTYTITVTDADTGCTDTASFDIQEAAPIDLSTSVVTDMTCANGNLGRVVANATGGWGNYRYTLTPPSGPQVGPKSGRTFGNLSVAGTYTLSVEDAEGCSTTFNFDLTPLDAPTVSLDAAASDFCYVPGVGATVTVTSTAGTAPLASHQYRINGGTLQGSPTFTGLTPGNYTIEVVDGNNCSDDLSITIEPQLRVSTSIESEIPCGGLPGYIRVRVNGGYFSGPGTKQYQVSSDNGATWSGLTTFTSNNFLYDTTVDGNYIFRIFDENTTNSACSAESAAIYLAPPASLDPPTIEVFDVSCGGATDNGRVIITPDATSGVPPYLINFDNRGLGSQSAFSDLAVGTYDVEIQDARGCLYTGTIDINNDPTPVPNANISEIPATCSLSAVSGGILINSVTDGTENFSFIIEDSFGNFIMREDDVARSSLPYPITDSALIPGEYRVITVDANGCTDLDVVTITTNEVVITPINHTPAVTCDDTGFTYTVHVSGGSGSYLIKLEHQPAFYSLNDLPLTDDHTFMNPGDNLQYGVTYTVMVEDQITNCVYEQEIPPIAGPSLTVTADSTPAACYPSTNGQITYEITGFAIGDDLMIELLNEQDGTRTTLEASINTTADPHTGNFNAPYGDYQIIVTNIADDCTGADTVTIDQNLPAIDILNTTPANCNSDGSITVQGRGGDGISYSFAFMPQGDVPIASDYGSATTFFGPAGDYDVYVMDSSGCSSFAIASIIPTDIPPVITTTVVNQCDFTSTAFDITVSVPDTIDTPLFSLGGEEHYGVLNGSVYEWTYIVSTPGDYVVGVVDANGCTSQATAHVYEFLSASGSFTTATTCNDADGEITIQTTGGSGDFTFELTGTDYNSNAVTTTQTSNVFTGLFPGDYSVHVVDNIMYDGTKFCDFTISNIHLDAAVTPVILPTTPHDVTCFGDDDGSIDIVLQAGTDIDGPITYQLVDFVTRTPITSNNSGSFPNLGPGNYEVEVTSARNCVAYSGELVITEPPAFAITASAPPFACENGANRYSSTTITVTVDPSNPGTLGSGYQYSITGYSDYQSSNTFEIVDNGSPQNITVYAVDGNGCQTYFDLPQLDTPDDITSTIIDVDVLNCRDDERVRIQVSGTTDFTVSAVSVAPVTPVTNTAGNDYVDVYLPAAGDYIFEVTDNIGGCTYPMPVHTVVEPISPTVVISEAKAVSCFNPGNDGELSIEVTDYVGAYTYNVYSNNDPGKTTVLATGSFNTANNPETITGLTGGNFFVEVISDEIPFCTSDSNSATIRTPNGALQVDAIEVGNTGCNDNTGKIEANGQGGWDGSAYEYRLLVSSDGGATYATEVAPFSTNSTFENLPNGDYQVEIRDVEGCTDTFELNLAPVPQIDAGIREPLSLQCPGGNNAVLEAYDPSTGDATSAIAGATGGYPGAGYNYRLLYLNSNDNTDISAASGLQNTPTFIGATGGFISEGWYAIEVSSSFDCLFVTDPYYVDPPPAVQPRLVQTRVPGCGGMGEIRLTIENPDPLFTYEYMAIENGVAIGTFVDMTGTSELFPGVAGITYQFDVRKKNALNVCPAVTSNGITMTDATGITLLPNLPDDISCASELDGRIESFINGGVGDNQFYLYAGDPVDAFSPSATATLVRGPQDHGTFEGLDAGTDYYIAVTSGATCSDIAGPFEIVRPQPILFNATPIPVSCFGEEDGGITIEVTSGGVGLIQFAIEPNFNEFFSDPSNPGMYTFDELAAGDYEILIQDENGCFEKQTLTVTEPAVVSIDDVATTPETCIGFADGTAQLTVSGGTPFVDPITMVSYYETMLVGPDSDGSEVFVRNDDLTFNGLEGGETYIVFVQDANMCGTDALIPIEIGVDLTAEAIVQYGCEGIFPNSTVSIEMQERNLLPNLLFSLDVDDINQADTQTTWGDLPAGDHTVYVYHENGCTSFEEFTIENYEPLTLSAVKTGPNELIATATGGFGGYEYFFQGESYGSDNIFTTNESMTVTVRVVDQNGCVAEVTVPFEFTGILEIPNFFTPDGDNKNDVWAPKNREFFPNIEVKIYDRYGRVVAELDAVSNWDGNYDGSPVPTGDYWYVVNANDKSKIRYVGHFTLYR